MVHGGMPRYALKCKLVSHGANPSMSMGQTELPRGCRGAVEGLSRGCPLDVGVAQQRLESVVPSRLFLLIKVSSATRRCRRDDQVLRIRGRSRFSA
jgi:hypothetical protein